MSMHMIAAMTNDKVIGANGKIPWSIPEEIKLFKELTTGNTVIMGKNTWLSLPERFRPLPNRINIIVSATMGQQQGAIICRTVNEAIEKAGNDHEIYCIGGAQAYAAMLPLTDTLHISWIKKHYAGDTYFPEIDFNGWEITESKEFEEFVYKKYSRIR